MISSMLSGAIIASWLWMHGDSHDADHHHHDNDDDGV
jgi:hypothetical protein